MKQSVPRLWLMLTILCVCLGARGQVGGSSAYNFLDVSGSSKIYGLGGVNISLVDPDDIMLTDQNPALLGPEMSRSLGVSYMRYIGGSNFAGAKYANAVGGYGAIGIGIHYFGYGSIKATDPTGTVTGSFSPLDMAVSAGYTHSFGANWRAGFALKLLYSAYDKFSAMAVATDLGVNYYNEDYDSSLSLVIANLGGQVKKFAEKADRLPIDVRLGWSKSIGNSPFNLSITAWNLTKWSLPYWKNGKTPEDEPELVNKFLPNLFRHLVFGIEWKPSDRFYVDLGYNYKTRTDMATYSRNFFSGISIGAGLKVRAFGVGVAFAQPHPSAATFMVNLTTNLYEF